MPLRSRLAPRALSRRAALVQYSRTQPRYIVNSFLKKGFVLPTAGQKLRKMLKAWACGLAALGLAASAALGQQYSFSAVTEGLGNLNINCIAQDRSGYLWVGTENGLYRYDGREFRQFGPADGLRGHIIQSLFAGPDGTLFVGTTTGIYFQQPAGQFSQVHPPAPVTDFSQRIGSVFTAIAPDQIVTADRSGAFLLRRMGTGNWAAEPMRLEGTEIWSVLAAPGGVLWYGCDDDLCRFEKGKTTHLRAALNLPEEHWLHLHLDGGGHLWIRGATHLGEVIPAQNHYQEHALPGRSNSVPYAELTEDSHGRMVASQGAALGLWEDGHWRMVTTANGLSRYDISELFVDRESSLWIGVVGHGLMRWVGQDQWEAYTAANGLSDDIIWATLRDQTGRLWIGTESGLDYLPAGSNTPKAWQAPGILTARSASLAESADGAVWMGSAAGNLVRIDLKIPGREAVEGAGGLSCAERWRIPYMGGHRRRPLRGGCRLRGLHSAPGGRRRNRAPPSALHRSEPGQQESALGRIRQGSLPARRVRLACHRSRPLRCNAV